MKTAKKRSRARGAAMVEAIVVMTTLLVFLGMTTWAQRAYGGKIDQAASVRRDALYFASHSCERANGDDPDTYADPALAGTNTSGGKSVLSIVGLVQTIRGKGDGFDITPTARSEKGPIAITGTALTHVGSDRVERGALVARLRTASAVGCNERRMGNGLRALLRMGWSFVKSLVTG